MGYSQSMSMPSNPCATMKSTHELANVRREASLAATSLNAPDQVHPPTEISVRKLGLLCLSFRSCLKLPAALLEDSSHVSSANVFCTSAHSSPRVQRPFWMLANA